jgi:glycosyltransferase involved in cell wall biosynthesis
MVEASHLVTVSTPRLAEVYSAWNPNVVVLPNAIPDWLPEIPPAPEGDTRRLVMGYTGSASHFDDYEAWSPVLETWMRRNAHRTLLRYYGLSKRPIGMPLSWAADVRPWVKLTENYLLGLRMDVGVAPLLPTEFNRGKSGIKAMEYAALGVPSVVQSVPQYQAQVLHGKTGFLCDTRTEWLDALGRLWNDSGLRARMGAAAREHARETMTMSSIVPMYETAYRRAAERVGVKL